MRKLVAESSMLKAMSESSLSTGVSNNTWDNDKIQLWPVEWVTPDSAIITNTWRTHLTTRITDYQFFFYWCEDLHATADINITLTFLDPHTVVLLTADSIFGLGWMQKDTWPSYLSESSFTEGLIRGRIKLFPLNEPAPLTSTQTRASTTATKTLFSSVQSPNQINSEKIRSIPRNSHQIKSQKNPRKWC